MIGGTDHNIAVALVFGAGVLINALGRSRDCFKCSIAGMLMMGVAIVYGVLSGFACLP